MAKRTNRSKRKKQRSEIGQNPEETSGLSRRQFLAGLAATSGALALAGCGEDLVPVSGGTGRTDPELQPLPDPNESGIEHIVVVMMENRSFDHFLGWVPGADGKQAGLEFRDKQGEIHPTSHLAPDYQNCHFQDPDHSYGGGRKQFAEGANDGWLRAGTDDVFPIGYYKQDDLALYGTLVPSWTTFDRYFCAILGPTFPNRLYMHSAQTDRTSNTFSRAKLTTIWDRIAEAGLTGTYYYSDLPVISLFGSQYLAISKSVDDFITDAAEGTLPNLSFIDPKFSGDGPSGMSHDDHPLADIRNGQAFLSRIYDAVTSSPNWPNTVFIINYDEWGGFFDHVPPPMAPLNEIDAKTGNDGRLGFRVPCIMASPLARRGFVGHQQYDHTSILKMIEWRWGLAPLSERDASANNIAHALDFTSPKDLSVPQIIVPQGPFGVSCFDREAVVRPGVQKMIAMARQIGFKIPR